ncbi:MAG: sugar phosphate isomerase/epimerase, partial [Planctomycetes bacterium]|nr:sugar phosphate isomerase/epimerase [Planctomycetota bacterium]
PISDNRTIGKGLDIYKQCAAEYNEAARLCAKAGIVLSYHNHSWELQEQDGKLPLEYLYEVTDPETVKLCIDAYWVRDGGLDPAAFVAKYASRLRILHAKDSYLEEVGKRSFSPVGEGVLDFPAIFKAADKSPAPWIVVEQDVPDHDRQAAECITSSRKAIKKMTGL